MTTYNTGNPLGSTDPRDLYDNAENLDRAVNSLSGTWKDRFGRIRPTVVGAIDKTGLVQYVDSALSDLSTAASKFYPTLALANADIANIEVNQPVHVGEVANGGLWYKATSGASTLTKSPYDPLTQAKNYVERAWLLNLFASPEFNLSLAERADGATVTDESGEAVLELISAQDFGGITFVRYLHEINEIGLQPNNTVITQVDYFLDAGETGRAELSVRFINAEGVEISREIVFGSVKGSWSTLVNKTNIPATTERIVVAILGRDTTEIAKFRRPRLVSLDSWLTLSADDLSTIKNIEDFFPKYNLFPNPMLTELGSTRYLATREIENGEPILNMNTPSVSGVWYRATVGNEILSIGDTIEYSAMGYCDVVAGCDIGILFYDASDNEISRTLDTSNKLSNEWELLKLRATIPDGTSYMALRFVSRPGNTVAKFKSAKLFSNVPRINEVNLGEYAGVASNSNVVYVSKSGEDTGTGTISNPYSSLNKAISMLPDGGEIVVLDSAEYRESLNITTKGTITIRPIRDNVVNIFGSDILNLTSTEHPDIFKCTTSKPIGNRSTTGRSPAIIFEWGKPSKPIPDDERSYLHRGLSHRLPYTELFDVQKDTDISKEDKLASLAASDGGWVYHEDTLYLKASGGGDALLKRFETRARPVLTHTGGKIILDRVISWFSRTHSFLFNGGAVERSNCIAYGGYSNGFADNANTVVGIKDIAGGCGNDGINGTLRASPNVGRDIEHRISATYFEPYAHDNYDDGISFHIKGDATIFGGLSEYNNDKDIAHVTGASCACYGTEVRGGNYGFGVATDASPYDDQRSVTSMLCVGTKASKNRYSYTSQNNSLMILRNVLSENPTIAGFNQLGESTMISNDSRYIGDESKAKSGTITVKNSELLI